MGFSSLSSDRAILLDKIGLWELFFSVTFIEKPVFGSSLEVQWLGLGVLTAVALDYTPSEGTRILQTSWGLPLSLHSRLKVVRSRTLG